MPESEYNETEIKTRPTTRWDWKVLPMPRRTQAVRIDHRYTAEEMDRIRLGFWPQLMEEKWFVFWEDPYLYLHRSWTGLLLFRVRFELEPPGQPGSCLQFSIFRLPALLSIRKTKFCRHDPFDDKNWN
jgi:hypothetical protein